MKKFLFYILALSALSGSVNAQYSSADGGAGGAGMSLYGMGEYANLGESIFIGALYIPQLESSIRPGSSKRMEMRIVADNMSARRFTQLWMDAITLSSSREERVAQAEQIQKFGKMFRANLIRGDKVSFEYTESNPQTIVIIDEVRIGTIAGAEFFNILLASWVGNTPLSGQLKAGVLRQIETEKRIPIKRQFAEIEYTQERQRQIADIYSGSNAGASTRPRENAEPAAQSNKTVEKSPGEKPAVKEASKESLNAARLEAARTARLEADRSAKLEEEARLEAERNAALEAQRNAKLEEEALVAAEQAEIARQKAERLAAEQAMFESEQKLLADEYRGKLVKWLGKYVEYPQRALEKEQQGRVELSISVDRNGGVLSKEITSSSDNTLLDQAALKILERGSPLPVMPESLVGDAFSFTMPVSFSL